MKKPKIHLICNAHLDPVWQWRWEEGCSEAIATFRNAVELINENKNFIFNHNEAILYQWVQKYDPVLFREIKKLVKKGRWFISGGWFLQPDVNMPGTESIIRQIIEGRKYFEQEFGSCPKVAYNFDSFGHSGGLPQILKLAGYKMYIHMRPEKRELELPSDLYRWRGVDGTEIIAYRTNVGFYHTEHNSPDTIEGRLNDGINYALKINRDIAVFWGLGNHGGGATREDLTIIDEYIQKENQVEILHSTTDHFYECINKEFKKLPIFEGEIQRNNTGCYTSISRIKRRSQQSLAQLVQAESLRAASWWLFDQKYPDKEFADAWKDHIFNDFHDIMPGSSTELVERDVLDQFGKVSIITRRESLGAAVAFNNQIQFNKPYIPLTILNSNPCLLRVPVEFECMIDYRPKWTGDWYLRLFKLDGIEITCQEEQIESCLPFNGWRRKISFYADLPQFGSANYNLELCEGKKENIESISLLNYEIDKSTGLIKNLKDENGNNLLKDNLFKPLVIEDTGDSWGTDVWSYRNVIGQFELTGLPKVIESGPIRNITESVFKYSNSKIIIKTIGYSELPIIEFRFRIHWNEERKRLKLSVPTLFEELRLLCEIPGGAITRPQDGQEHVHNRWFLMQGKLNGIDSSIGVINNGQYGLDFLNGEVRLSVLRSAAYCHFKDFQLDDSRGWKFMDQGVHDVDLLVLVGQPERIIKSIAGLADWIAAPPIVYSHLPIGIFKEQSIKKITTNNLFTIDQNNIRLLACKQSSDGKALIIRFHETIGCSTITNLYLNYPKKKIKLKFSPFEIKTMRIEKSGKWKAIDLIFG
jgi:alpha-mannosidase